MGLERGDDQCDRWSRYPQYHNCVSEYKHQSIKSSPFHCMIGKYQVMIFVTCFSAFCFSFCFSTWFCSTWCSVLDQIIPDLNPFWPKIVLFFLNKNVCIVVVLTHTWIDHERSLNHKRNNHYELLFCFDSSEIRTSVEQNAFSTCYPQCQ